MSSTAFLTDSSVVQRFEEAPTSPGGKSCGLPISTTYLVVTSSDSGPAGASIGLRGSGSAGSAPAVDAWNCWMEMGWDFFGGIFYRRK